MNITLPNGNTKSLGLIQDLSYLPLCEESDDFKSSDYSGYKPYSIPKSSIWNKRYYDCDEYIEYEDKFRMKIKSCHMCDVRRTGCTSKTTPRYYCKQKKEIQTKLF